MSQNSRMLSRHKRKKSNTLLNILIGVVLVLIVTVVWNIISDDEETVKEVEQENSTSVEPTEQETKIEEEDKELVSQEIEEEDVDPSSDSGTETESQNSSSEAPAENEEGVRIESSDDPNVLEVEVNQNWLPIGTSQTGEHVSIYDKESVDWKEKVSAIAYATKLSESEMYIKRIENGGSPQKSIGTVTSKDNKEIYRVYLEWVDGQGWKPTKKETLKAQP